MLQKILDRLLNRSALPGAEDHAHGDHVHPNDVATVDISPRARAGQKARADSGPPGDLPSLPSPKKTFWPEGEEPWREGLDVAETVSSERSGRDSRHGEAPSDPPDEAREPDDPDTQDSFIAEIARVGPTEGRAPLPDLVAHQLIGGGRYRILGLLGKGGMGAVYEAEDLRLGRSVALKVLSHDGGNDEWRLRFSREVRATAAISHRNVAALYDAHEDGGRYFITMELVPGTSLAAVLRRGPLPIERIVQIARDVALGLGAAHAKGIVHRDIKPDNILVSDDGQVKLLDFGIAKIVDDSLHKLPSHGIRPTTKPGQMIGTMQYMSPQQARGAELDHRTDIFSFGVVLYEMLTERRPFRGAKTEQLFHAIVYEAPEPPSSVNPRTPPALEAIVHRCLEKQPEDRFQDAGELLAALDGGPVWAIPRAKLAATGAEAAHSAGAKGGVVGGGRRLQWRGRSWRSWGLVGAAVLVGGLGGGWLAKRVVPGEAVETEATPTAKVDSATPPPSAIVPPRGNEGSLPTPVSTAAPTNEPPRAQASAAPPPTSTSTSSSPPKPTSPPQGSKGPPNGKVTPTGTEKPVAPPTTVPATASGNGPPTLQIYPPYLPSGKK